MITSFNFEPYVPLFIPNLLKAELFLARKSPSSSDFLSRKLALDFVKELSLVLPNVMKQWRAELLEIISDSYRFDRIKTVRDSSLEAIRVLRELPEPDEIHDIINETPKRQVSQDRAVEETKSPSATSFKSSGSSSSKKLSIATQKRRNARKQPKVSS